MVLRREYGASMILSWDFRGNFHGILITSQETSRELEWDPCAGNP